MLTVGLEQLLAISGPVSFTVLTPINQFHNSTSPIIVLLGDNHLGSGAMCDTSDICEMYQDRCISTVSVEWYRLLDSISSKERPVDYMVNASRFPEKNLMVESMFDTKLLNSKDSTYVIKQSDEPFFDRVKIGKDFLTLL